MAETIQDERQQLPAAKRSLIKKMADRFDLQPESFMDTLRNTVMKPDRNGRQASNAEVAAFLSVANEHGLNPFTKEIHAFVGRDGGVVPIVGVDGWARIVNRQPSYNGVTFEWETDEKGKPVACTCKMFVKDRDFAVEVTEYLDECRRNTAPWNDMPRRMLRHKAFMQAARLAFGLAGLYDPDEGRDITEGRMEAETIEPDIVDTEATERPQARTSRSDQVADRFYREPEPDIEQEASEAFGGDEALQEPTTVDDPDNAADGPQPEPAPSDDPAANLDRRKKYDRCLAVCIDVGGLTYDEAVEALDEFAQRQFRGKTFAELDGDQEASVKIQLSQVRDWQAFPKASAF
jgi:phage recombination protein Bet